MLNIPASSITVETLFHSGRDFEGFRGGQRGGFVHSPRVRLNTHKSHRFAEAFVARWLRETRGAETWAGTVALFESVTRRHVCTDDVLHRLSKAFGRERVERLRVLTPRLVTPDVIARLPDASWQFIEVKRTRDWPPRDEQLRALAYLQWLELGSSGIVRLLPEGRKHRGPAERDVEPFAVTLDAYATA